MLNFLVSHVVLSGILLASILSDQGLFSVFSEVLQILIDNLFWSRAFGSDIVYVIGGKSHIYCHTWGTALGGLLISQVRRFTKVS